MNAIYSLWASFANLARSLNRLASVADAVADEAERRVEIIGHTPAAPVPTLPGILGGEVLVEATNGHAELPVKGGRRSR